MMPRLASVLALVLASSSVARADTITLDSGAVLQGDLARFEFGGDCQISVTEGDLNGVIVIVPCHRVASFVRTSPRMPVAIGVVGGGGDPAAAPAAIEAQAAARAVSFGAAAPVAAAPAAAAPVAAAPAAAAAAPSTARSAPVVETEAIALSPAVDAPDADAPAAEPAPLEDDASGFFDDLLGASPFDAEPDPESPAALPAPSIVANGPQPIADVNARTTTPANQPRTAPTMEEAAAPAEPPASRAVSF